MMFRLSGGTAAQRAVIRLALADLNAVLGTDLRALGHASITRRIVIGGDALFDERTDLGHCEQLVDVPGCPDTVTIALRATLTAGALYEVFVHELGHYLGLRHTRRGVMKGTGRPRRAQLTPSRRLNTVIDLCQQLVRHRAKNALQHT